MFPGHEGGRIGEARVPVGTTSDLVYRGEHVGREAIALHDRPRRLNKVGIGIIKGQDDGPARDRTAASDVPLPQVRCDRPITPSPEKPQLVFELSGRHPILRKLRWSLIGDAMIHENGDSKGQA